jgi:hypothetical protein
LGSNGGEVAAGGLAALAELYLNRLGESRSRKARTIEHTRIAFPSCSLNIDTSMARYKKMNLVIGASG